MTSFYENIEKEPLDLDKEADNFKNLLIQAQNEVQWYIKLDAFGKTANIIFLNAFSVGGYKYPISGLGIQWLAFQQMTTTLYSSELDEQYDYFTENYQGFVSTFNNYLDANEKLFVIQDSFQNEILKRAEEKKSFVSNCSSYFFYVLIVTSITILSFLLYIFILSFKKTSSKDYIMYIFLNANALAAAFLFVSALLFKSLSTSSKNYVGFFDYLLSQKNLLSDSPIFFKKDEAEILNQCLNQDGDLTKFIGINKSEGRLQKLYNFYFSFSDVQTICKNFSAYPESDIKDGENYNKKAEKYWNDKKFVPFDKQLKKSLQDFFNEFNRYSNSLSDLGTFQNKDQNQKVFNDYWTCTSEYCDSPYLYTSKENAKDVTNICLVFTEWTVEEVRERYKDISFDFPDVVETKEIGFVFETYQNVLKEYLKEGEEKLKELVEDYNELSEKRKVVFQKILQRCDNMYAFGKEINSLYSSSIGSEGLFSGLNCMSIRSYINILYFKFENDFQKLADKCFIFTIISTCLYILGLFSIALVTYPFSALFSNEQTKTCKIQGFQHENQTLSQSYSILRQQNISTIPIITEELEKPQVIQVQQKQK